MKNRYLSTRIMAIMMAAAMVVSAAPAAFAAERADSETIKEVGLIIGSFVWVLHQASVIRQFIYQSYITPALFAGNWLPFIGWIVFALLLSLIIYRLCIHETMAMGGGIPQVKGELLGIFHMKWLSVLYVKFIGVVLGILGGLSIGREAPSVQIGAAAAKGISRLFGRFPLEEKYLITSGSSAGLAAAFSAPLAGTVFALEEMNQSFSSAVLLPSMAAAVTATMVTRYIFGESALFIFPTMPDSTIALSRCYLWSIRCVI